MEKQTYVFGKRNYMMMVAGLVLLVIGYLLMMGGGSEDPEVFNPEIFSARRITWAPIFILAGLLVEVFAIMSKSTNE